MKFKMIYAKVIVILLIIQKIMMRKLNITKQKQQVVTNKYTR